MKNKILSALFLLLIATNCTENENNEPTTFLPELSTQKPTNLTENTVTMGGTITDNGNSEISQKGITWSTTSVEPDLNDSKTEHGSGSEAFSSTMENLEAGTTYYARAYATNAVGTNYGKTILFQTHLGDIELSTLDATEITEVSAIISSTITNNGSKEITEKGICWATTSLTPTINDNIIKQGTGNENFTSSLIDLQPGTIYYVRTYATTADGTNYGNTIVFQTGLPLPTVTTKEAIQITQNTAQTGGMVTYPSNLLITQRGVCWNITANPTLENNFSSDGTGNGEYISGLNELAPNTTYYIRAYAINSEDIIAYGNEISFKTKAIAATLTTKEISEVTQTTAKSGGNITNDGGDTIVTRGVCWSTNPTPTIDNDKSVDGEGTGTFESELINLIPNTTYYVRAYATNSEGTTAYGNEETLTTDLASIVYPENGFYGKNFLDPNYIEGSSGSHSFSATLPKGTSLKIVMTALQIERDENGFAYTWSFSSTSINNWYITTYNRDTNIQTFEVISNSANSNINIFMPNEPITVRVDYYENGSEIPTRTKIVEVK